LEYASSVWNPHTKCNVDKIETVQQRAARFVCHDYSRYSHVSTLINALGWESLEQRKLNNQVCMFYKIYSGLVGITLPAEINPVTRVSRYSNWLNDYEICNLCIYEFFLFVYIYKAALIFKVIWSLFHLLGIFLYVKLFYIY